MKKILYWVCVLIFIGGAVVFALPDLYRLKNHIENQKTIQTFEAQNLVIEPEAADENDSKKGSDGKPSAELYAKMQEYNEEIFANGQANLRDPWSMEQEVLDLDAYGVKDGVIGVISVPRMGVELPIYLGAKEENMSRGAVLLGQTSFPINGENSNSVIAAHRGWKGSPMFRDIEAMQIGDEVTVRNPWETLTYQVTDIRVIMPDDIEQVLIQEGKNMVTLLTCHPYTGNSRRYAVYCEKVAVGAAEDRADGQSDADGQNGTAISDANAEAERVRVQAQQEDQKLLKQDTFLRKVGYVVIAVMGVLIIISGIRRK